MPLVKKRKTFKNEKDVLKIQNVAAPVLSDSVKDDLKRVRECSPTPEPVIKKKFAQDPVEQFKRIFQNTTYNLEGIVYHSSLPAFNLNSEPVTSCSELQPYPSCSITSPYPIYIAPNHPDAYDICRRRVYMRDAFQNRLGRAATAYKRATKLTRDLRQLEQEDTYHKSLFDFTERIEQNPDKHFYGNHDYYYTGGNLCVLPQEDNIVHVDGHDLWNLHVSEFPCVNVEVCARLDECNSEEFDSNSEIFEIQHLPSLKGTDENCFSVRQRNRITLCSWDPLNKTLQSLVKFKSKNASFISSGYAPHQKDKILTSNMMQQIQFYDIKTYTPTMCALYVHDDKKHITSWNSIKHWKDSNFLFANESTLSILDIRTTADKWLQQTFRHSKRAYACDTISSLAVSEFDNLIYVGTSHKLHCLDLRKLGESFESTGAVCCWAHMIDYGPLLISTARIENNEYIALGGPLAGDVRICELTCQSNLDESEANPPEHLYKSCRLAYQPPTLQEAYESARIAGKCLDPTADMARRINHCNTGLTFYHYTNDENIKLTFLLSANSIGDVFGQTLKIREKCNDNDAGIAPSEEELRTNQKSNDLMSNYNIDICKKVPTTLNYTDKVKLTAMRKIFRCPLLSGFKIANDSIENNCTHEEQETNIPKKNRQKLGGWQKSLQSLHNYKDALVPDLLSIWDLEFEKQNFINLKDESLTIKQDPNSFVTSWLNKSLPQEPMTSVPIANLRSASTFEVDVTGLDFTQSSFLCDGFADAAHSTQTSRLLNDSTLSRFDSTLIEPNTSAFTMPSTKVAKKKKPKKPKAAKGF